MACAAAMPAVPARLYSPSIVRFVYCRRRLASQGRSPRKPVPTAPVAPLTEIPSVHASFHDQAVRFQVVRRPDHVAPAHQHDRHRRPQWLRQVQHHRCGALGDGRKLGQPPARRLADRRDLLRLLGAQAGVAGDGGADLRQFRSHHLRRVRLVQRNLGQAPGQPRRHQRVLPQRHQVPAPRHHRPVPGHRPGAAQLLDHRAGHDQPDHRGAPGRSARLPGRSRRHFQIQGTPQGNRNAHPSYARKPRSPG